RRTGTPRATTCRRPTGPGRIFGTDRGRARLAHGSRCAPYRQRCVCISDRREGLVRWSAPGRVNIIGETTEYNDGLALPMAIPQRTTVEAKPATGGASMIRAYSPGRADAEFGLDTAPGDVTGWAAYVAGTTWALRQLGVPITATDLHITSDVPAGAGLSSSAALECAVGCALLGLAGAALDRTVLATAARRAENEYVGAP